MLAANSEFLSPTSDYVIFSIAFLGLFGVLEVCLRQFARGARLPWPAWGILGAILLGGFFQSRNACQEAKDQIINLVGMLAPTYAQELERMGHSRLTQDTKPDDPSYLEMIEAQKRWQKSNPVAHDIYTIRKLPDGSRVFIVDSETDYDMDGKFSGVKEERTPIGTLYEESDERLDDALRGYGGFDDEIIKDQWGLWVGTWYPITVNGKVDAVLGVDFDARRWIDAVNSANYIVMQRLGLFILAVGIGGSALAIQRADLARRGDMERRSRMAEERMLLTVRKLPLGFIEWSAKAEVVAWNPSAERIFGFKGEEMLGQQAFTIIVPPAAREHTEKVWSVLMKQAGGTHSINDNVTKDGRTIICEWFNTPLVDAEGRVTGVFSLMQDITERVNLEKHLQQAQRLSAVGQLAAGVAHDFNNILTIITGHAGLLLSQENMPVDSRSELERIEDAALRAAGLTRQLLAFSRQQAMFARPLHLDEVVHHTTTMLSRVLGVDVSLNVRLDATKLAIEADPAMLDQVITNLILNARDAMPRGGSITVAVERVDVTPDKAQVDPDAQPGPAVCLSISDTGDGIPPEHLPRIFEPFFTTKQTGKGTGLGLSVVHGIVKQHHGWIEVRSAAGKGTSFHIYFPPTNKVPEPDANVRANPPVRIAPKLRKTVLVVEDEAIVRELARMILERDGFRVMEAEDGPTALAIWSRHSQEIDLLLTDMVMPNGISGRDLSLRLLAERPDLPIIYASGYTMEFTAPDFQPNDHQVYLQKPYLADQLLATVRKCLHVEDGRFSAA